MLDDRSIVCANFVAHLTQADLTLLEQSAPRSERLGDLHHDLDALEAALFAEATFDAVFVPELGDSSLIPASPFLVFAVAVAKTTTDLAHASYVEEWLGPRQRAPIFDVSGIRDFLSSSERRLVLAELLGSYTHVHSGAVFVRTPRGIRRQRFSELDPVRLASLLEVVPEPEHPGIYRRLGDLALFLTGVFPDHTATHGLGPLAEQRLLRSSGIARSAPESHLPGFGDASAVLLLERLGQRWYRLAVELVPPPRPVALRVVAELSERFSNARRVLNLVTDRYLFPLRDQLFDRG